MRRDKSYEHGIASSGGWASFDQFLFERKGNVWNQAMSDVPLIEEMYEQVMKPEIYFDAEKHARLYQENYADLHRAVIDIKLPIYKIYNFWQPWLGGYYGEDGGHRYLGGAAAAAEYVRIDQELKKSMGR